MFYRIEKKELNLLAAYNRKEGPSQAEKMAKLFALPIVLFLIVGTTFVFLYQTNQLQQNKINELIAQNNELQAEIETVGLEAYDELTQLEASFENLQKMDQQISSLPQITKLKLLGLETALLGGMELDAIDYDQSTGEIHAELSSLYVTNIERYVGAIKQNPNYQHVIYKGYDEVRESKQTEEKVTDKEEQEENQSNKKEEAKDTSTIDYYAFEITLTLGGE